MLLFAPQVLLAHYIFQITSYALYLHWRYTRGTSDLTYNYVRPHIPSNGHTCTNIIATTDFPSALYLRSIFQPSSTYLLQHSDDTCSLLTSQEQAQVALNSFDYTCDTSFLSIATCRSHTCTRIIAATYCSSALHF